MTVLSHEDQEKLLKSLPKFKIVVPLETIESECDSEILKKLLEDLLDLALRYAESVCRWQRIVKENGASFDEQGTRASIEDTRTRIHDAFDSQVNILCRTLSQHGKSTKWRDSVGHDRPAAGRLALCLSFQYIKQKEGGAQ